MSQEVAVPQIPQAVPPQPSQSFVNYAGLRANILSKIGSAKKTVILITDFLTDGDISSSLYLAKYRKVRVLVYLGGPKLNFYLSRVKFLKRQGITVMVRPNLVGFSEATILITDNRVYRINRDLDTLKPNKPSKMVLGSPKYNRRLFEALSKAPKNANIVPRPYQRAGNPRGRSAGSGWGSPYRGDRSGTYNYDRGAPQRRPDNVPKVLPKVPLYQKETAPVVEETVKNKPSSVEWNTETESETIDEKKQNSETPKQENLLQPPAKNKEGQPKDERPFNFADPKSSPKEENP
ncbi:MAG: hypothetical protein HRU19_04655 [Pseudobacteriovorax sp.]|nr:hypothetical protein [Pseudobacteriovorax sp.]